MQNCSHSNHNGRLEIERKRGGEEKAQKEGRELAPPKQGKARQVCLPTGLIPLQACWVMQEAACPWMGGIVVVWEKKKDREIKAVVVAGSQVQRRLQVCM